MEKLTKKILIEKIKDLYETDEGDFKRKIALYLNRLIEQESSQEIKSQLEDIKNELLYQTLSFKKPVENIESLRLLLIEKIKTLPQLS